MSRSDSDLLSDVTSAITAIHSHLERGTLSEGLVMDAVAMRLLEIGEAVKALSDDTKSAEPDIKWREIAGMRDRLAPHYFATHPEIIQSTVDKDLDALAAAADRAQRRLSAADGGSAVE